MNLNKDNREHVFKQWNPFQRTVLISLFITLCVLCMTTISSAVSIRVLILDNEVKAVPELDDISKVGDLKGKLLFKGTEYSGKIEIFRGVKGLFVVNELPLEEYVKSVVTVEVGEDWPLEALKAQAVAVRTYAIYNILNSRSDLYHLTSSTLSQVYTGMKPDPLIEYAVNSTRGEILTYNGKPINAMYHSTSGGITELPEEVFNRAYSYLTSVKTDCSSSPLYVWERRLPKKDVQRLLPIENVQNIEITSKTKTGRAKELRITGDDNVLHMKATELRKTLGWRRLPSTWFSISTSDDLIIFNGKGYGHGVGMCQWSSMEMAKKGMNYKDILATFYINSVIELYERR